MEAPSPSTNITEYLMIKVYPFLDQNYIIKMREINQNIEILIDQEDNCSIDYYIVLLSLDQIKNSGKNFSNLIL